MVAQKPLLRLQCRECGRPEFMNSKPCAEAIVEGDGKLLLVKRTIEPFFGYWDIPGGFLDDGEHPEDGVRREVREETGIDSRIRRLIGVYLDVYPGEELINTLTFSYLAEPLGEPEARDESDEVRYFGANEIPAKLAFAHARRVIEDWLRQGSE